MRTVSYQSAPHDVKMHYEALIQSLEAKHLPLFFSYIGAYPEYLSYITEQLTANLQHRTFTELIETMSNQLYKTVHETLPKSSMMGTWIESHSPTPSFHHFQQDLIRIHVINVKIAYVFLALREAVKGWAVAAKQLPRQAESPTAGSSPVPEAQPFLYEDMMVLLPPSSEASASHTTTGTGTVVRDKEITQQSKAIDQQLLPEYFRLAQRDFENHMHTTPFWVVRTGIESMVLQTLPHLPNLIFSPINVTIELTKKYDDFPDLLYLMSEHFPTYAVQRMMFSAYLVGKK